MINRKVDEVKEKINNKVINIIKLDNILMSYGYNSIMDNRIAINNILKDNTVVYNSIDHSIIIDYEVVKNNNYESTIKILNVEEW